MTGLDDNELLNEPLSKYGLPVELVMESFHTPTLGVIMAPKRWRISALIDNRQSKENKCPAA